LGGFAPVRVFFVYQNLFLIIFVYHNRECDNSRSEAIRRLLERGLAAEQGAKPPRPHEKCRAAGRSIREARDALEHSREKIELALAALARLVERSMASEPDATRSSQRGPVRK